MFQCVRVRKYATYSPRLYKSDHPSDTGAANSLAKHFKEDKATLLFAYNLFLFSLCNELLMSFSIPFNRHTFCRQGGGNRQFYTVTLSMDHIQWPFFLESNSQWDTKML